MVLGVILAAVVFLSLVWLVFAIKFIIASLAGMSFFDAGLLNVLLYTIFVCLPEFIIWMVFGFVSQHLNSRLVARQMYKLFSQMKKNQEYSDLLARIMLETGENIRNSFMMNHFELMLSDINEHLSEIIKKEKLVTQEQSEYLWQKVQNGGKWAFGKVIVENYNRQPSFKTKLYDDAVADNVLAGTIMEFCARYQSLVGLLEKYDKEKTFLNIIETGVLGKVFSILASISDDLRRTRDIKPSIQEDLSCVSDDKTVEDDVDDSKKNNFSGLFKRFSTRNQDLPKIRKAEKDEFSLALERSFSSAPETEKNVEDEVSHIEPVFEKKADDDSKVDDVEKMSSQKALDDLKKEWQKIEVKNDISEDTLAYPFGGWTDADKYQK